MSLETYVLSPSGPCPDILLVRYGSLIEPVDQEILLASAALEANHSYHIHGATSTPIDLTLPACTVPGDQILVEIHEGIAPIQIQSGGSNVWASPAPTPQSVLTLSCNGTAWEVIE